MARSRDAGIPTTAPYSSPDFKRAEPAYLTKGSALFKAAQRVVRDHAKSSNGIHAQVPLSAIKELDDALKAFGVDGMLMEPRSDLMVRLESDDVCQASRFEGLETVVE